MRRFPLAAIVLLAMLPLLSGCPLLRWFGFPVGDKVPYNPKQGQGETVVRKDIQFADIPVPLGFVLRRPQSTSFRGSSFRFGRFIYEGAWTMRWTADFYRRQMAVSKWRHVKTDERSLYDETQYYRKGKETCAVLIRSRTDGMRVEILVNEDNRDLAAKSR